MAFASLNLTDQVSLSFAKGIDPHLLGHLANFLHFHGMYSLIEI
jgi:hypothetical protein